MDLLYPVGVVIDEQLFTFKAILLEGFAEESFQSVQ